MGTNVSLYGVIGLSEGHMIANHPHIWGDWPSCDPLRGSNGRYPGTCPGGNKDLKPILGPWHTSIHHASILTITTIYHHAII